MSDDERFLDDLDTAALSLSHIDGLSNESKAVREAIRRLKEGPSPPPPGSVRVRVAVSLANGERATCVVIDKLTDAEAMRISRNHSSYLRRTPSHEAIAAIDVPPIAVPIVAASVEAFDPEATV